MVARSSVSDELNEPYVGQFDPMLDPDREPGVHVVTSIEEARTVFDSEVEHELGISGDEFLRRWEAGEYGPYAEIPDTPDGWRIRRLVEVIPTFRVVDGR